jgi:hypothetical protein
MNSYKMYHTHKTADCQEETAQFVVGANSNANISATAVVRGLHDTGQVQERAQKQNPWQCVGTKYRE